MWSRVADRWASFGPYYAMFPVSFARSVIAEHTSVGDLIVDPFSGRGTSLFCAYEAGRQAVGSELNPVGWVYSVTKLNPAAEDLVLTRLSSLACQAQESKPSREGLSVFFERCFCPRVLDFLLIARANLNWRNSVVDRTLMAFILTYLHGKIGDSGQPQALSNQMRQTKAMAPDYSVRWWEANGFRSPPDICPSEFLRSRISWRYKHGAPRFDRLASKLGDCRKVIMREGKRRPAEAKLLLTSPPYCGVTSYYYDQWLRFWMLGDSSHPTREGEQWKSKFENAEAYRSLLFQAFSACQPLLANDAKLYVRTDARPLTLDATLQVLRQLFPKKHLAIVEAPFTKPTQTFLFGDKSLKPGEVDIILQP